ncbi:MAG: DMT family transporter [Actinomycetota bacterium]|nr:DMT family transporter [Actinomycetota bacterium]
MAQITTSQSTDTRSDLVGIGLAATAAIAFGTLAISAKYAYDAGAGPLPLLAGRFVIATTLLAVVRAARPRKRVTSRGQTGRLMLLGAFGYALESALFFAALENAPAGVVGLVFYSYPLWTALIALATRLEPFRARLLIALGLGSAGIALVFSVPETGFKGPALALGAAVAVAIYLVAMQVWAQGVDATSSALWTSAGAACALVVAALVSRQSLPSGAFGPTLALGVASATAFVLLYAAIERLGSSRAAIATMLEPIATVVLAALLLDEPVTARIAIGALLVVAALPVLAIRRRARVDAPPLA